MKWRDRQTDRQMERLNNKSLNVRVFYTLLHFHVTWGKISNRFRMENKPDFRQNGTLT